jgi:hypothetical protein
MIIDSKNLKETILNATGSQSLPLTCSVVICNAGSPITLTLPSAVTYPGKKYIFKQVNSGAVTIDTVSSQQIDSSVSVVLNEVNETITLMSNGTSWSVLDAGSVSLEETRVDYFTVDATDEANGYVSLSKCIGSAGEKNFVLSFLIGGSSLRYGVHYTAMNNDSNNALVIIFKTSGVVTGIASPAYPSIGCDIFAGQEFMTIYLKSLTETYLKDTVTGANYRLKVESGLLGVELV